MSLILSIRQPWAWLILHAGKDIENRDWWTSRRGRILIHAGKGMTRDEYDSAWGTMREVKRTWGTIPKELSLPDFRYFDELRGGIVGSVEIVDCVTDSASPWFFGRYGFVLRAPRAIPFIPLKGQLGFFAVPGTPSA